MISKKSNNQKQDLKTKLEKIVVNSGIGRLSQQPGFTDKVLPEIMSEFALITGQRPAPRTAKKSIAGFKLREGATIGLQATLRGKRMMAFLQKLNATALPRLRDFRGLNLTSVDRAGILSIGLREQVVFPEIMAEQSKVNFGMQITFVPKTKNRVEAIQLYRELGIPLKKA